MICPVCKNGMNTVQILVGDALTQLKTLPDASVHCCVTSPPYYGLRDYGTGKWEGGHSGRDHKNGPLASTKSTLQGYTGPDVKLAVGGMPYRDVCGKCGAKRIDQQIGLEETPEAYVTKLVEVFREVRRVLRGDGTLWLNLGDSYGAATQSNRNGKGKSTLRGGNVHPDEPYNAGTAKATVRTNSLPKQLLGIPWRVAFALQADGWILRQDIIWHKPNPMPESVKDRCTKAHEYLFLLAKSKRYYFDAGAMKEEAKTKPHGPGYVTFDPNSKRNDRTPGNEANGGRVWGADGMKNRRSVWTLPTKPYKGAHFAVFPTTLVEPCIKAGCPAGGTVLDPFGGSGTTGQVAKSLGRNAILIELNPNYIPLIEARVV